MPFFIPSLNSYPDINIAFRACLEKLLSNGINVLVREKETIELLDFSFYIENPLKRALAIPYRYNNIAATIAETLWVFGGRNDLDFLKHFLPDCFEWSDDKKIWRGAYGPRLRQWSDYRDEISFVPKYVASKIYHDQIYNIEISLLRDKFTREAVLVIPEPDDYDPDLITKDRPCTMFVQFLCRGEKLHCLTRMRSNDIVWGAFNINIFEWTFLQEILAGILDLEIGLYCHNASSFHIYEVMFKRANNILKSNFKYNLYSTGLLPKPMKFRSLTEFYHSVNVALNILDHASNLFCFDPESRTTPQQIFLLQEQLFSSLSQDTKSFITFLNIPLSFLFAKKDLIKEAIGILTLNHDIEFSYCIPYLEYLHRFLSQKPEKQQEFTELIKKNFYLDAETKKFIFQEWD